MSGKSIALNWSRCRSGRPSSLGRRQVWLGFDAESRLCASIERFPDQGSKLYLVIVDLDEAGRRVSRVMDADPRLSRAQRKAARLVGLARNVVRYTPLSGGATRKHSDSGLSPAGDDSLSNGNSRGAARRAK